MNSNSTEIQIETSNNKSNDGEQKSKKNLYLPNDNFN